MQNYNLISSIEYCANYISNISEILLYSHIPPVAVALILSIFVYKQNQTLKLSKILLLITVIFLTWVALNLFIWFGYGNAGILMAAWSQIEFFACMLFLLTFYFCHLYLRKQELQLKFKIILFLPLVPVLLLSTSAYLSGYDAQECIAIESDTYYNYVSTLKIFYTILITLFLTYSYLRRPKNVTTREVGVLGIGVVGFLYPFLLSSYVSSVTGNFMYEIYGLFSIIVFIGALAYLIVKYNAFNVRLVTAEVFVIILILLVTSQIFSYTTITSLVINTVNALLVSIFGFFMIRSVKKEIKQREEIEHLAKSLEKANERLKELDKMKSEFVSIASHQLRSPLTSIKGYASMLAEGSYGTIPERAKEILDKIVDSSRFMALSIEDYLNVSRIEAGNMKYEYTTFDLQKVAQTTVEDMRQAAVKKSLVLSFATDHADPLMVRADIGKTKQVITNIIDNSIKYTPKGIVQVSMHYDKAKNTAHVVIEDSGVGMSPDTLAGLFDKFVRAKNANSINVTGTGLGLYVARIMVTQMGGSIWAESDGEGKGSRFIVEFPVVG